MNFWDAFGNDVKQSEVKNLINQNASFETICDQPTFIDEFLAQNDYILNYLSENNILEKLVSYITDVSDFKEAQYSQKCHYSYFSFIILSTCNSKVYDQLFNRSDLLERLFAIPNQNPETYVTSQGYFAAMVKNWISNQNSRQNSFIKFLDLNFSRFILPIVHNLSASNAEIIKEILTSRAESLDKQMLNLFQYLTDYYISENFDPNFLLKNPEALL